MKATHKYTEGKTNRQLANMALKAMSNIQEYDNGTIRNPHELASSVLKDGRTLIQTIYEDGYVDYNDGYYVVEVDDYVMYVDVTGRYLNEVDMTGVEYSMDYDEGLEPYEENEDMETKNIQLVSQYGEVITCSVKEVVKHESGRVTYQMDNKKCNDFHNSKYNEDAGDCRVRSVDVYASGNYTVFASYQNRNGNYRQGAQGIDAEILQIN